MHLVCQKPTQVDPDPRTLRALDERFAMNSVEAQGILRVRAIPQVSQSRVMLRNTLRKSGRAEGSHFGPKASLHTKASSTQASPRELSKAGLHSGHRHHCTQATHRTALRSLLSCTQKNGFFGLRAPPLNSVSAYQ